MRNTANTFSSSERALILKYLSTLDTTATFSPAVFVELFISALKYLGTELRTDVNEYLLWLDAVTRCIEMRQQFVCGDWKLAVQGITSMLSSVMADFFTRATPGFLSRISLIRRLKQIGTLLANWTAEQLVVYESFSYETDLFSMHVQSFASELPVSLTNSSFAFNDSTQNSSIATPFAFAPSGFSYKENDRLLTVDGTATSPQKYAMATLVYSRKYMTGDNTTTLRTISRGVFNVSLWYYNATSSEYGMVEQNMHINNKLFKPVITFGSIQSPTNISQSFCSCPNGSTLCRTRVNYNASTVSCEFDATGLVFASVNYTSIVVDPAFGNIVLLAIYIAVITTLFSGLSLYFMHLDECESFPPAAFLSPPDISSRLHTQFLRAHKLPFGLSGVILLIFKLYHPLFSIWCRFNPVVSRVHRAIANMILCQGTTVLALYLINSYSDSLLTNNYSVFWTSLILSVIIWPFHLLLVSAYCLILEKVYFTLSVIRKDTPTPYRQATESPMSTPRRLLEKDKEVVEETVKAKYPPAIKDATPPENPEALETFGEGKDSKSVNVPAESSSKHAAQYLHEDPNHHRAIEESHVMHINESASNVNKLTGILANMSSVSSPPVQPPPLIVPKPAAAAAAAQSQLVLASRDQLAALNLAARRKSPGGEPVLFSQAIEANVDTSYNLDAMSQAFRTEPVAPAAAADVSIHIAAQQNQDQEHQMPETPVSPPTRPVPDEDDKSASRVSEQPAEEDARSAAPEEKPPMTMTIAVCDAPCIIQPPNEEFRSPGSPISTIVIHNKPRCGSVSASADVSPATARPFRTETNEELGVEKAVAKDAPVVQPLDCSELPAKDDVSVSDCSPLQPHPKRVLGLSVFRDFIARLVFTMGLVLSLYYVSTTVLSSEGELVDKWLETAVLVWVYTLLVWSTVYTFAISLLAYIYGVAVREAAKRFCALLLPRDVPAMINQYAHRTASTA